MFKIHLKIDSNTDMSKQVGQFMFVVNGECFGQMNFETTSIPYTLASLLKYKEKDVYGICKIDFIHSTKELYLQLNPDSVRLITYFKDSNEEEIEIFSEEIAIEQFDREIDQINQFFHFYCHGNSKLVSL